MANEKIIFDTEVKVGSSVGSVKSLKAELRAVTNELGSLEQGSEAFIKAASKAGALKDKIGDVRNAVDAFNPEKKFQALAGVVGIAANGFAAMQGAMALMGSESEDLNKVIAKTQGAIALSSGLNGLLGMKDAFKLLGTQVMQLIPALNSMGAAMLGAITGGIAIALVLIISYWKDLKFLITGSIDAVKLSSKEMLDAVNKGHEEYKKAANERTAIAEREAKLKLKGKDLDLELAKIDRQKKIDEAVSSGKLADEKKLIEDEYQKSIQDIKDKYQKEENKKATEKKKKEEQDAKDRAKALRDQAIEVRNERMAMEAKDKEDILKEGTDAFEAELASITAQAETNVAVYYKEAKAKKEIDEASIEAKKQMYQATSNILGSLSGLVGAQTEEGKMLAVAQATINTYLGASEAFTGSLKIDPSGILGSVLAGAAVLTGLANVKNILSVQVPSKNGGGGGGATPAAPRIPQSVTGTMLNQNKPMTTTTVGGAVQKVIVTETDITNTQNKVKGIIRKATIK